jgi:sulfonate transport system substrate-binding protein
MVSSEHSTPGEQPVDSSRRSLLKAAAALAVGTGAAMAGGAGALLSSQSAFAQSNSKTLRIGFQKYGNFVVLKARGTVGETPPIFAQAGGVDFVYIANEPPAPKGEALVVQQDSPIRTVADLRGKKVALNRGSNVHYLLVKALQRAGLTYTDIQPVYLTPADARAAFVQRSVDAWVIWDPYLAAIQRQANARVLTDGEGVVRNTQYYVSSRKFADAQPQVLHTLLDELNQVDQWGRNNISAVAAQLSPLVGLDAATLELALGRAAYGVQPITDATLAYQQQIADTFTDLKLIPKKLTVADARWNSVG